MIYCLGLHWAHTTPPVRHIIKVHIYPLLYPLYRDKPRHIHNTSIVTSTDLNHHLVSRGLLLLLAEDVDVPARHVGNVRGVVATTLLAQLRHLGDLLGRELDLLEVVGDPRRRDGLGDDADAADLRPGEDDVRTADGLAETLGRRLGDFLDLGAVEEEGDAEAVVTEGLSSLVLNATYVEGKRGRHTE